MFLYLRYSGNSTIYRLSGSTEGQIWVLSRIHEGDHDVTRARGHSQTLMIVRQPPGVYQHPAWLRVCDRAIVSDEPAPSALVVDSRLIQGDVDGIRGRVVVRPQGRLLVRTIPHDEVHKRSRRLSTREIDMTQRFIMKPSRSFKL